MNKPKTMGDLVAMEDAEFEEFLSESYQSHSVAQLIRDLRSLAITMQEVLHDRNPNARFRGLDVRLDGTNDDDDGGRPIDVL